MKQILNRLYEHDKLSRDEARQILVDISNGTYNHMQVAAFTTVFNMRPITLSELQGFRDALLELCVPLDFKGTETLDIVGTGGDGKNTFNISTTSAVVLAGAGYKVTKHGSYGVSSSVGSSNVLMALGYEFTNDRDTLQRQLDEANMCFLHAPLFHPAMKNVGPIRRELGVKTFFNMLGPMVNPAFPNKQLVGVFSLELARLYGYLYQQTGKQFTILHAMDGYDEVSLTGPTKYLDNAGDHVMYPEEMGLPTLKAKELSGGKTVEDAAHIFVDVLNNQGTPAQTAAVVANAAMAIRTYRPNLSLTEAVAAAQESLQRGQAKASFEAFIAQ